MNDANEAIDMMTEERDPYEIHTFEAPTIRGALASVREALGSDALILEQQFELDRVIVRASMEAPVPEPVRIEISDDARALDESGTSLNTENLIDRGVEARFVPEGADGFSEANAYDAVVLEDFRHARTVGELRKSLLQRLTYCPYRSGEEEGLIAFLGNAGVGKSSTLVKVLVGWLQENRAEDAVVVTLDNRSLGGSESLYLACQLLGVRLVESSSAQLDATLLQIGCGGEHKHEGPRLVLIDTPAFDARDLQANAIASSLPVQRVWVCSAHHSPSSIRKQFDAIGHLGVDAVTVSHLEPDIECDALLNHLYRRRIPMWWLGVGSQLESGLVVASARSASASMFGEALDDVPDLYFGSEASCLAVGSRV